METAKTEEKQVKTDEKDVKSVEKPLKIVKNNKNSLKNSNNSTASILSPTERQPIIKKKIAYNRLIGMVKRGEYVTARLTAKALGISFNTVCSYINTKKLQEVAQENIGKYVDRIQKAGIKDWKASDRLLQYAMGAAEEKNTTNNNVINVYNQQGKVAVQVNT